jgi:hypothetical protein
MAAANYTLRRLVFHHLDDLRLSTSELKLISFLEMPTYRRVSRQPTSTSSRRIKF